MMFSKSCEYAIKAALHIYVVSKDGRKLSISEIAKATDSPVPFMAKILQPLARRGIISSVKGPGGGFFMDKKAEPVFVMDIIDLFDGGLAFERCGLGLKECSEEFPCPIHKEFKNYSLRLRNLLKKRTIQDLAHQIGQGKTFLKNA